MTLAKAPNGALVNAEVLASISQAAYLEKTVRQLADNIWVIGGYSVANCTVFRMAEGLVVLDTGDSAEEGQRFREVIESQISKEPIIAIIYSHSHYALGAGAMVDNPERVTVIGHPKLNETVEENVKHGGIMASVPEVSPVVVARTAEQFNYFLPAEGEDAAVSAGIGFKAPAFLPATKTVQDGETVTIGRIDFQFFTKYRSDDYSLTVWLPKERVVLSNLYWPGAALLYAPRGGGRFHPLEWINGLKLTRDLRPDTLISVHSQAVVGQEQARETLLNYMDLIALTYDQSLRGMLQGLGPDALRDFIYKPKHLSAPPYNKDLFGETSWYPPDLYASAFGWFNRDARTLYKLPPAEEAKRLVTLIGGEEKVLAEARRAYDDKEYAWSAQLADYLCEINPRGQEARSVKAQALRRLGHISMSSIGRAFTISQARALEGKVQIPVYFLPPAEAVAASPALFINYYRVRIDPKKAENTDQVLSFHIDDEKAVGLHVRRGVVEYIPDLSKYYRASDIEMNMDGMTWAQLYLNQTDLHSALASNKATVTKGDAADAEEMLGMFDRFDMKTHLTVPPVE